MSKPLDFRCNVDSNGIYSLHNKSLLINLQRKILKAFYALKGLIIF